MLKKLSAIHLSNAIVSPVLNQGIGGLYDESGTPVEESFHWSLNKKVIYLEDNFTGNQTALENDGRVVIWGGYHASHFGHFLLESLARLWISAYSKHPIIWSNYWPLSFEWQKNIIEILDIKNELIQCSTPTRFKGVIVPSPGLIFDNYINKDYLQFTQKYEFDNVSTPRYSKIWISRSSQKNRAALNEEQLELKLVALGWYILKPEEYSIKMQLEILSGADVLAGIEGSAFHLLILLKHVKCKVLLIRRTKSIIYDLISHGLNLEHVNIFDHLDQLSYGSYEALNYKFKSLDKTLAIILANS